MILAVGVVVIAGWILVKMLPGVGTTTAVATPKSLSYSDGISMAMPGSWHVDNSDIALHYEHVIAYFGTGDGSMKCGADYVPGAGGTCEESITLPANGIEVKLSAFYGPPEPPHAIRQATSFAPVATELPAGQYGSDAVVQWTIYRPSDRLNTFVLTAYMTGSDVSTMNSQLSTLVDSATAVVLPTTVN